MRRCHNKELKIGIYYDKELRIQVQNLQKTFSLPSLYPHLHLDIFHGKICSTQHRHQAFRLSPEMKNVRS